MNLPSDETLLFGLVLISLPLALLVHWLMG
jgi:hypothetical protein